MKLTDKRFWIFEVIMLLCGAATTCVEALNYGISPFYLIGHLVTFPLCFCISGIAVWKIAKGDGVWQLVGYSLLFSTIAYSLFNIILYPHIWSTFRCGYLLVIGLLLCIVFHLSRHFLLLCL